jgi:hypothetical protein
MLQQSEGRTRPSGLVLGAWLILEYARWPKTSFGSSFAGDSGWSRSNTQPPHDPAGGHVQQVQVDSQRPEAGELVLQFLQQVF